MDESKIVEEIAVKVMGWRRLTHAESEAPGTFDDDPEFAAALSSGWFDADGNEIKGWQAEEPECPREDDPRWNPLTDPAACKMVREKLAERFDGVAMTIMTHKKKRIYAVTVYNLDTNGRPHTLPETRADTEERATCLCALKTVE